MSLPICAQKCLLFALSLTFLCSTVYPETKVYSVFPQLAIGSGWSADICLMNQKDNYETLELSLFASDGTPFSVQTSLGTGAQFSVSIGDGATKIIHLSSTSVVKTGYAVIAAPATSSIRASLVFSYKEGDRVVNQLGVSQTAPACNFSFPVELDAARAVNMGVAIANPTLGATSGTPLSVAVSLIDEYGQLSRFKTLTLAPGTHLPRFLNESELFSGVDDFRGSVNVSSDKPFALIALRTEQAYSVGTVAVTPAPLVPPFKLVDIPRSELEPNNSVAEAISLTLPSVVSGNFGATDVDFFKFDGKKGQIFSAGTESMAPAQYEDPILTLQKADGTVLIENDQNGTAGENDSFLQVVLPEDATYYLKVTDQKKSLYSYKLHARILGQDKPANQVQLDSVRPQSVIRGGRVVLRLSGSNLSGIQSIDFAPAAGLQLVDKSGVSTQVTMTVSVAADTALGPHQVTVKTSNGTSNAVTLTITDTGSTAPALSNLTVSAPYYQSGNAYYDFTVDLVDPDGDLVSDIPTGKICEVWLKKSTGSNTCRFSHSINFAGTSGKLSFTLILYSYTNCQSQVSLELADTHGNLSNTLLFSPPVWTCGP